MMRAAAASGRPDAAIAPSAREAGSRVHTSSVSLAVGAWLVLCLIWGSTWLFIKLGLADLPPVSFAGIRFVVAAAVLWGIVAIRRTPLPRGVRAWGYLALTGFLAFSVNYGLLFWGEERTSSGLAAVLQATIPAFGLALAHMLLPSDRMTLPKVFGVALGIAGVAVIFSDRATLAGPDALRGGIAIVVGAFAVALSNVLVKARGGSFDPVILSAAQMTFGLVPLVAMGRALEGSPFAFHWTRRAALSALPERPIHISAAKGLKHGVGRSNDSLMYYKPLNVLDILISDRMSSAAPTPRYDALACRRHWDFSSAGIFQRPTLQTRILPVTMVSLSSKGNGLALLRRLWF